MLSGLFKVLRVYIGFRAYKAYGAGALLDLSFSDVLWLSGFGLLRLRAVGIKHIRK